MKTILAYGDSLTFGTDAETQGRHQYEDRWPSVLEAGLGGTVRVIPEGLGGRTTAFDDATGECDLNGARILPVMLRSHQPLDCIVIMLGTNDLKAYVHGSAHGAAMGIQRLIQIIKFYPYGHQTEAPKIVIVSPPHAVPTPQENMSAMFEQGIAESKKFAQHYKRVAREAGCAFFDAATVAEATPLDGVHLDARNTRAIGEALVPVINEVLGLRPEAAAI
jgi:lysophospholipase L1-like esterase